MDNYIATISYTSATFVPQDYFPCDGRLLPINNFRALYSLIGKRFGGDGVNNFALPTIPPLDGITPMICIEGLYPPRPYATLSTAKTAPKKKVTAKKVAKKTAKKKK